MLKTKKSHRRGLYSGARRITIYTVQCVYRPPSGFELEWMGAHGTRRETSPMKLSGDVRVRAMVDLISSNSYT